MFKKRKEADEWARLKEYCQELSFGSFYIIVKNGKPYKLERVIKEVVLFDEKKFKKGIKK